MKKDKKTNNGSQNITQKTEKSPNKRIQLNTE